MQQKSVVSLYVYDEAKEAHLVYSLCESQINGTVEQIG